MTSYPQSDAYMPIGSCTGNKVSYSRDLKPENIMYDQKKKNIKIIDFGSGIKFDSSEIKPRKRVGTVSIHLCSLITLLHKS